MDVAAPYARSVNSKMQAFKCVKHYIIGSIYGAREKLYKEQRTFAGKSRASGRFANRNTEKGKIYKYLTQNSYNLTVEALRISREGAIIQLTKQERRHGI